MGGGIRPRGEPHDTLLLGTTLRSLCTPVSRCRTASTLAHANVWMLERAFNCLQKDRLSKVLVGLVDSQRALSTKTCGPKQNCQQPSYPQLRAPKMPDPPGSSGWTERDRGCCAVQMWLLVLSLMCTLLTYQVLQFSYQGGTEDTQGS